MATQRHTKIKKKKMSRYHSEKRYKGRDADIIATINIEVKG